MMSRPLYTQDENDKNLHQLLRSAPSRACSCYCLHELPWGPCRIHPCHRPLHHLTTRDTHAISCTVCSIHTGNRPDCQTSQALHQSPDQQIIQPQFLSLLETKTMLQPTLINLRNEPTASISFYQFRACRLHSVTIT